MNSVQTNTINIKLHPCVHRWKKVGVCKECKVQRIKWVCEKCNKIYRGEGAPPISKKPTPIS